VNGPAKKPIMAVDEKQKMFNMQVEFYNTMS